MSKANNNLDNHDCTRTQLSIEKKSCCQEDWQINNLIIMLPTCSQLIALLLIQISHKKHHVCSVSPTIRFNGKDEIKPNRKNLHKKHL
ncbi:hypothetical protein Hanom_Chr10g00942501 [Helianthus anomalus]